MSHDVIDRLRQISIGFQQAKILLAAAELRLFDHLAEGGTATEIARRSGTQVPALEILLDALVAMGILEKHGTRYSNVPDAAHSLLESAPSHFVAMLRHQNRLFRHWAFLEERVRGQALPGGIDVDTDADHENFIRAMYAGSHRLAEDVVAKIDLTGVRTMADLGGGPGHYLAAFMRQAPDATPFLVDLPATLSVAARVQSGNADWPRVRPVAWDLYTEPAPASLPALDLAFLSQVVHSESFDANRDLFGKLQEVVAPGGRLVVHENVAEPGRTAPLGAAIFAVNMLMMTAGGRTYTEEEIAGWGRDAGFVFERSERLSERSYLIVLRKP